MKNIAEKDFRYDSTKFQFGKKKGLLQNRIKKNYFDKQFWRIA